MEKKKKDPTKSAFCAIVQWKNQSVGSQFPHYSQFEGKNASEREQLVGMLNYLVRNFDKFSYCHFIVNNYPKSVEKVKVNETLFVIKGGLFYFTPSTIEESVSLSPWVAPGFNPEYIQIIKGTLRQRFRQLKITKQADITKAAEQADKEALIIQTIA